MMEKILTAPYCYNLIYIYEIRDEAHKGCLKIGRTSFASNKTSVELQNKSILEPIAHNRIRQQTGTAAVKYNLKYVELAVRTNSNGDVEDFFDDDVHSVLLKSGIKRAKFDLDIAPREWFKVDLQTAINAIKAVKEGRKSLYNAEISHDFSKIDLYPNQEKAVKDTFAAFANGNQMLWDAKMRFGKTITALEFVKQANEKNSNFKKILIVTNKLDVCSGWYDDFGKIFYEADSKWRFGSKKGYGLTFEELVEETDRFVYFASLPDLKGSVETGGKFDKNKEILNTQWDLLIIDEAHAGTQTFKGECVFEKLKSNTATHTTKELYLSGTPFNLISQYDQKDIFSWSYIDEQEAKENWDYIRNPVNPYRKMPKMKIYTYDLGTLIDNPLYVDLSNGMFNFGEFFKVYSGDYEKDLEQISSDKIGKFVHETDVIKFLDLMTSNIHENNYPYSTEEYQDFFKHTLWKIPGVASGLALSELLRKHPIFKHFHIVNIAGEGDKYEDDNRSEAIQKVKDAVKEYERTITLSCGKCTTGVTIPEWTAVFMLYGSSSVTATSYLQTIFRAQSPGCIDGKRKETCYVFDFAPDRALEVLADSVNLHHKAGVANDIETMKSMEELLKFCPVIAMTGSRMESYNVETMLQQLKRVYVNKIVENGFVHRKIFNLSMLNNEKLNLNDFDGLLELKNSINSKERSKVVITDAGLDKQGKKKQGPKDSKEKSKESKEIAVAKSILIAVLARIPLMIYGIEANENIDITLDNFANDENIDEASWDEFMPLSKEKFNDIKKYIDPDMFILCSREIRNKLKYANTLPIHDRCKRIAELFLTFRNPEKETVLTPWRVVNMHMSDCLGGYDFYDEKHENMLDEPRYVSRGKVTNDTLGNNNAKILEINSKTGLYPLYIAYSMFRQKLKMQLVTMSSDELWQKTIEENIYVVCRTKMAQQITRKTLIGNNRSIRTNIMHYENMIDKLKSNFNEVVSVISNKATWDRLANKKSLGGIMKFDAIVGNPPYQENLSNGDNSRSLARQLFPDFVKLAIELKPDYASLITPSRWFAGEAQDGSFIKLREFLKTRNHFVKIINHENSNDLFDNVVIKGGLNYWLYSNDYSGKVEFSAYSNNDKPVVAKRDLFEEGLDIVLSNAFDFGIIQKVCVEEGSLMDIATGRNAFNIVGKESTVNSITKKEKYEGSIPIRCKGNTIRYADKNIVTKNLNIFKSYKVFISKSAGDPAKDQNVIGTPYIGEPFSACTDSLIPIGSFSTYAEAENLLKYLMTKLSRYMISILKVSQNVYQNVYKFVPLQDFTENSDIDWTKSIAEIDKQLYKKYNLSQEEINFIETTIKPME